MIDPTTGPTWPRHPILGAAVAAVALLAVSLGTLLVRGSSYFEWGFWPSLGLAWMAVTVGYVAGPSLIYLCCWATLRRGVKANPSLVLFGVLVVLAMWAGAELSPVAETASRSLPWFGVLAVAVLLSTVVTVAVGYRGRAH